MIITPHPCGVFCLWDDRQHLIWKWEVVIEEKYKNMKNDLKNIQKNLKGKSASNIAAEHILSLH